MTSKRERGVVCVRDWLVVLASCCAASCATAGSVPAQRGELHGTGNPDAPPTLAALPELPAAAPANTERTHQGMLVARQTLDTKLPAPPGDRSFAALQDWADTQVAGWVAQRQDQIDSARARMLLEGDATPAEQILSHAVLALLQEDTARSLAGIPAPKELDNEHEIAAMYRDLMSEQADSFASAALLELRDCANLAYRGPEDMRPFADYCHARFDRLHGELQAREDKPGNSAGGERTAKAGVQ